MKDIVIKHLNKQYSFTQSTYVTYVLYDKTDKVEVGLPSVFKSITKIFGISESELTEIFDVWADQKAIELSNRITEYKFAYYEKYGVELPISEIKEQSIGDNGWLAGM